MLQLIGTKLFKLYPADKAGKCWLVQNCDELDAQALPMVLSVYDENGNLVTKLDLSEFFITVDVCSKDGWLVVKSST